MYFINKIEVYIIYLFFAIRTKKYEDRYNIPCCLTGHIAI